MSGTAALGLCIRNCAEGLPAVLKNILAIRPLFERLTVIAAYDHSTDNSLKLLEEFGLMHGDIAVIRLPQPPGPVRTERISRARNAILAEIRQRFWDVKYFIMMDANNYSCVGPIRPAVLAAALAREDWDAISWDRDAGYYDYWALSYDPFVYSCYHFDTPITLELMRQHWKGVMDEARAADPNALITVYSAFNGFAVYRADIFLDCSYDWKIDMTYFPMEIVIKQAFALSANIRDILIDDCEHRKFHLEAIRDYGARVRVSLDSLFGIAEPAEADVERRGPA